MASNENSHNYGDEPADHVNHSWLSKGQATWAPPPPSTQYPDSTARCRLTRTIGPPQLAAGRGTYRQQQTIIPATARGGLKLAKVDPSRGSMLSATAPFLPEVHMCITFPYWASLQVSVNHPSLLPPLSCYRDSFLFPRNSTRLQVIHTHRTCVIRLHRHHHHPRLTRRKGFAGQICP